MNTIKLKPGKLILCILIPLAVGQLASLLTGDSAAVYSTLIKPDFSPPAAVFPIVWTIIYILMGISSYLICISGDENAKTALIWYGIQLMFNFAWSLLFFYLSDYLISFIWIIALIFIIEIMIAEFYKVNPIAAYLQIPYLLWCIFAALLNFSIYRLNR